MIEAVGHAVSRLIRIRYGAMMLPRGLKRGAYMELDEVDIRALTLAAGNARERSPDAQGEYAPDQRQERGPRNERGNAGNGGRAERGPRGQFGRGQRGRRSNNVAGNSGETNENPMRIAVIVSDSLNPSARASDIIHGSDRVIEGKS